MVPKRKSDAIEISEKAVAGPSTTSDTNTTDTETKNLETSRKKARVADESAAAESSTDKDTPKSWRDMKLPGEDADGGVPVYDDCGEIRRKINVLLKTPNFKVTHWLKEIGVNIKLCVDDSDSKVKTTGRENGAGNGTYYAAYVYFEKVRVLEGKKKTPKRTKCEKEMPNGYALENAPRYVWVGPRR